MIRSFRSELEESIWKGKRSRKHSLDMQTAALRKLRMLHQAKVLGDLQIPPSNRLEQLKGDREGQYSIRINRQWRLCFRWQEGIAYDVEIVDYHK